ncbi:MAG: class I SAM-dependent methyltransferase [Deltaproteobacteria bacterium]|nr:class I SAM-dependent methyltransferase [Deltaproteobacteria bacterium]
MKNKPVFQGLKRAYYELEGKDYNAVHYQQNRNRYVKMIEAVLPLSKSVNILDIGVGFCYLAKFLKLQGFQVFAIDFFYGDLPKYRCEQNHIPFCFLNIEVDDMPFEKEFFDVIILGEVIEHFTYSPLIPLKKIRDALEKDGLFILTTPNVFRIFELLRILRGRSLFKPLRSSHQKRPIIYKGKRFYYRHNKLYSMESLKQIVRRSGFRIIASGFVNEGISFKENPIKVFLRCICWPFTLMIPQLRDFLWIQAKKEG